MGRRRRPTFVHDSVLSGFDALLAFPNTDVHRLATKIDEAGVDLEEFHLIAPYGTNSKEWRKTKMDQSHRSRQYSLFLCAAWASNFEFRYRRISCNSGGRL